MSKLLQSLILTGTSDGLRNVRSINERLEAIPYEKFPFCCSSRADGNSAEREVNMSMRSSMPIRSSYRQSLQSYQIPKNEQVPVSAPPEQPKPAPQQKVFPKKPEEFWSPQNV